MGIKFFILLILGALLFHTSHAQDAIILNTGYAIKCKIIEVEANDIKYKIVDSAGYPLNIINKSEVSSITFNGAQSNFSQNDSIFHSGGEDAQLYYRNYRTAATVTFVTTFLFGPIFGLIPAISFSSTKPRLSNLDIPQGVNIQNNPNYVANYAIEARRIKSHKVWKNYGIATAVLVGLALLTIR